jgi:hypothetical protein
MHLHCEILEYNCIFLISSLAWWRRALEKLLMTQLIRKYCISLKQNGHYHFGKNPQLDIILNHMILVPTLSICFLKLYFNIILPYVPRQMDTCILVFEWKCICSSPPPWTLHVVSITSSLIQSLIVYNENSINYETSHYVILSIHLLVPFFKSTYTPQHFVMKWVFLTALCIMNIHCTLPLRGFFKTFAFTFEISFIGCCV